MEGSGGRVRIEGGCVGVVRVRGRRGKGGWGGGEGEEVGQAHIMLDA